MEKGISRLGESCCWLAAAGLLPAGYQLRADSPQMPWGLLILQSRCAPGGDKSRAEFLSAINFEN